MPHLAFCAADSGRCTDKKWWPVKHVPLDNVKQMVAPARPHVVILGAGASRQAFPQGEAGGRRLPVIGDFVEAIGLEATLEKSPVVWRDRDFEAVFSELVRREDCQAVSQELEDRIHDYFSAMFLPPKPTLYDHLLLSLRPKDGIATFNWDPLLFEAACRLRKMVELPHLLFLHGNVAIGYCAEDRVKGPISGRCNKCHRPYTPSRLLYPVENKDYTSDTAIELDWREFSNGLKLAYVVTVFGYGAPPADAAAVEALSNAWGSPSVRNLEEFEFIDTAEEDDVIGRWRQFVHSHHYRFYSDFYESTLGQHPRRSCEAVWSRTQELEMFAPDPIPKHADFSELEKWVSTYRTTEETV